MNTDDLIALLENQLKESTQASNLYQIRLRRTIDKLKEGYYLKDEFILIYDLEALGFVDVGRQIRKGLFV